MNSAKATITLLGKRCFSQTLTPMESTVPLATAEPYAFYKKVGSPKYFVAPMVDQSELPYRMLTRKYGADICYTPMFHARLFSTSEKYRKEMFKPTAEDRPLVV